MRIPRWAEPSFEVSNSVYSNSAGRDCRWIDKSHRMTHLSVHREQIAANYVQFPLFH